jgi:hypothetical protein
MQARKHAQVSVALSVTYKGEPRPEPVWLMRYRLPSGKDSRSVLGRAWRKKGRPAAGYLTESDALLRAEAFAAEHSGDTPDARRSFRVALEVFLRYSEDEKGLRGSTLVNYRRIGDRLAERRWRSDLTWADRPLERRSPMAT